MECSAIIQQLVRVLPESPQWLLARGRFEETIRLVRTIASTNGRDLTPDFIVATKDMGKQDNSTEGERGYRRCFYGTGLWVKWVVPLG
ncbi:uncharacterized protein TNCV_117381 [Trichonephila clavipes]|nr:uncharacterized protein TNCV_117381 [Trichonephila clavipes]